MGGKMSPSFGRFLSPLLVYYIILTIFSWFEAHTACLYSIFLDLNNLSNKSGITIVDKNLQMWILSDNFRPTTRTPAWWISKRGGNRRHFDPGPGLSGEFRPTFLIVVLNYHFHLVLWSPHIGSSFGAFIILFRIRNLRMWIRVLT
jgi:hypothetical protein